LYKALLFKGKEGGEGKENKMEQSH